MARTKRRWYRSPGILAVAFITALALTGLVYAHWTSTLHVEGQVNTGSAWLGWDGGQTGTDDDGDPFNDFAVIPDDDGGSWPQVWDEMWGPGSSSDPAALGGQDRYDKDVGACWAGVDEQFDPMLNNGSSVLRINAENTYPSYHCTIWSGIANNGSVPMKGSGPVEFGVEKGFYECGPYLFEDGSPLPGPVNYDENGPFVDFDNDFEFNDGDIRIFGDDFGEFLDYDDNGVFDGNDLRVSQDCEFFGQSLELKQAGDGHWVAGTYRDPEQCQEEWEDGFCPELNLFGFGEGDQRQLGCGAQIDPGDFIPINLGLHVKQDAMQNTTYQFSIHQQYVNWNEFDESMCSPITVTPGYAFEPGTKVGEAAGVRWKGENSGNEIYLGVPDLGVGGNRLEAGQTWATDGTYPVNFVWDAGANAISTTVDSSTLTYDFDDELQPGCLSANWDRLDILMKDNADSGAPPNVQFKNVDLNGFPLGDFAHAATSDSGQRFQHWTVTGFDFSQSFTVSGDLVISGDWNNNENTVVEVIVGCTP